jgi:uncharacterized protein (DUF2225 family)
MWMMSASTTKPEFEDVAVAANVLLSAVASSFNRISRSMGETSRKLAKSHDRIKALSVAGAVARAADLRPHAVRMR